MRGRSRHVRMCIFWMLFSGTFSLLSGCASDRVVRCNGKLEPINAAAVVPAVNFEAPESEPVKRSERQ